MNKAKRKRLGELLMEEGMLSEEQLAEALTIQKNTGGKLGEVLVSSGIVKQEYIIRVLEVKMGIPYIHPDASTVDPEVIRTVGEEFARKYDVIPIKIQGGKLVVTMTDPLNIQLIDDISMIAGMEVYPAFATAEEIRKAISIYYGNQKVVMAAQEYKKEYAKERKTHGEPEETLDESVENSPIVKMLDLVIEQAIRTKASDIHIEPTEKYFKVRLRQDGQMIEIMRQDMDIYPAFSTRVKIVSGMNIAEKRKPQDGRISTFIDGDPYEIRISSLPTVFGEKLVLRIINSADLIKPKEGIIKYAGDLARYDEILKNSYGIILITGPTGSGKSTTMYTTVSELNQSDVNIITVEDPIEAVIEGVNQVPINQKSGMTFASALRSILRQDPDIIVVGEIRDSETAEIATRAAVTGHLVISTLHTNDCASTVTRLVDMGIEPFLISISLVGVVAQRLVKLICPVCKKEYEPSESELRLLEMDAADGMKLYRGAGCALCNNTGYSGRMAIFEIMNVTYDVRNLINSGAHATEIKQQAMSEGMLTLRESCVRIVREGKTTIDELVRVAYTG